jgi:multisubunit Na+/H+ antiporter MnhB subunit
MPYDQSWMGYGLVGGLQAGAISAVVGVLMFALFHAIGRRGHWSEARKIGWAYLLALVFSGGGDIGNLFYFNFARLQSLQLLRAKLAEVHDPDNLGMRVFCEMVGVGVGIFAAWIVIGWLARRRARGTAAR